MNLSVSRRLRGSLRNLFFAGLLSCVIGMVNFFVSAAIGFGVSVDNLEALTLFLASLILIFLPTMVGVFAAATMSPRFSSLWLFLTLAPIVPGFSAGLVPTAPALDKIIAVAVVPMLGALVIAALARARVLKDVKKSN